VFVTVVSECCQGIVRLGAVNADEHKQLGGQYGVRGFPSIKIFGTNKNSPSDYNGIHMYIIIVKYIHFQDGIHTIIMYPILNVLC